METGSNPPAMDLNRFADSVCLFVCSTVCSLCSPFAIALCVFLFPCTGRAVRPWSPPLCPASDLLTTSQTPCRPHRRGSGWRTWALTRATASRYSTSLYGYSTKGLMTATIMYVVWYCIVLYFTVLCCNIL